MDPVLVQSIAAIAGGLAAAFVVLRLLDRSMRGTHGRKRRRFDGGGTSNQARHALDEPQAGGAMGYPVARAGGHRLSLEPGTGFHVRWRYGDDDVAWFVLPDERWARAVFDVLESQLHTWPDEPPPAAPRKLGKRLCRAKIGKRRIELWRFRDRLTVVAVERRTEVGRAAVRTEDHGRELVDRLANEPAAAPDEAPSGPQPVAAAAPSTTPPDGDTEFDRLFQ